MPQLIRILVQRLFLDLWKSRSVLVPNWQFHSVQNIIGLFSLRRFSALLWRDSLKWAECWPIGREMLHISDSLGDTRSRNNWVHWKYFRTIYSWNSDRSFGLFSWLILYKRCNRNAHIIFYIRRSWFYSFCNSAYNICTLSCKQYEADNWFLDVVGVLAVLYSCSRASTSESC